MQQIVDAVPAGAGAEDFLTLPVPESHRGAAVLRAEPPGPARR